MNQAHSVSIAWYRALTLKERVAALRADGSPAQISEPNVEQAQRRAERWKSQAPFTSTSLFAQRLASDEITEDEFLELLGEPAEALQARLPEPPRWVAELTRAFARYASPEANPASPRRPDAGQHVGSFLNIIEPFIHQACERLRDGLRALAETHSSLPFERATAEAALFANLPRQLLTVLNPTLALELNVARLQNELEGETSEERYASFLRRLRQRDKALAILNEYPVLARQLVLHVNKWVDFSLEFIEHLCADWDELKATLNGGNDPGLLTQVKASAGDTHRGGRSVLIAKFSSGFQVVYKPKSMSIDVHFQQLLTWLNERGDHPPFRTLKVIDRGDYGWMEFVAAEGCASLDEVRRFYERQGGYLAFLYALEATDYHYDNLIACGEHPLLIDLESLFHPRTEEIDTAQTDGVAAAAVVYSVLRVGLLPRRIWSNDENQEGLDISGLGTVAGQLSPHPIHYWEGAGTDEMRVARKRITLPGGNNRPNLNGAEINILDYSEAIAEGFNAIYRLLMRHRNELLADDGPLASFAQDEVRVIVRPTKSYALLLHESFHPDLLRDALERDRFFDRLWIGVEQRPSLARVIAAERDDLQYGDIPMFTTSPSSTDIWSSRKERILNFYDDAGMTLVRNRLEHLSEEDLARQSWFIKASFASLSMSGARWPAYRLREPQAIANPERLLAAARAVGERLEALALRREQDVSWVGMSFVNERYWSPLPLGLDFYNGLPGIALFLAYLGHMTGEERFTSLAETTVATVRRQVESRKASVKIIGAFNGWGGWIYTLTHLGSLWNRPALLEEAEAVVGLLPPLIEEDQQLDVLGGAAGCLATLINLYRRKPSESTLEVALQAGQRLIDSGRPMKQGTGWITPAARVKPLAGFSHGAAGIAWALMELAALTGDARFRQASLSGLAYERSLFSPQEANWPDLRESGVAATTEELPSENFMIAWCHGAAGIGMSRLCIAQHHTDAEIQSEIAVALQTTLTRGFGHNHSLCHGDIGNLDLLLHASEILKDEQWKLQTQRMASIILESIEKHGWLCGIPLGVESPGLMTGLAGIGYGLLRASQPTRVPSLLTLASPK